MRWLRGIFFKWVAAIGLVVVLFTTWLALQCTTSKMSSARGNIAVVGVRPNGPASSTANSMVDRCVMVVIVVHSGINRTRHRNAIRQTWLSPKMLTGYSVRYWFLIGALSASPTEKERLVVEHEHYGDLLIMWNVSNDYSSLTNRSLQSLIHFDHNYNLSFLLKTDDDVFLNTPQILFDLKTHLPKQRLYWGRSSCYNPPLSEGRWYETKWRSCDTYFPYNYGGMYILSSDLVHLVAENAPYLKIYTCEDVSMGAWLAPYNILRVDDVRIFAGHIGGKCSKGFIAVHINHYLAHKQIRKLYDNLKRRQVICTGVTKERPISWTTITSNCYKDPISVT